MPRRIAVSSPSYTEALEFIKAVREIGANRVYVNGDTFDVHFPSTPVDDMQEVDFNPLPPLDKMDPFQQEMVLLASAG